jgi:ketosteroid isomerase-like protein
MSEENAATVRRGIDAWNRRDLESFLATHSPDVEFDWSRSRGPLQGVYGGRDGLEALWNEFYSAFTEVRIEAHGFTEVEPSDVIVPNTAHMRGRDGIEVTARSALVFTVESGLISRLQMFQALPEALEAAGLSQ